MLQSFSRKHVFFASHLHPFDQFYFWEIKIVVEFQFARFQFLFVAITNCDNWISWKVVLVNAHNNDISAYWTTYDTSEERHKWDDTENDRKKCIPRLARNHDDFGILKLVCLLAMFP